jgi:stage II sporulation protein P
VDEQGNPIYNAYVTFHLGDEDNWNNSHMSTTDRYGIARLYLYVQEENFRVFVNHNPDFIHDKKTYEYPADGRVYDVVVMPAAPDFSVTIVDTDGDPIPGVTMHLATTDVFTASKYGKTDENGYVCWYDVDMSHTYKISGIDLFGFEYIEEVVFQPGQNHITVVMERKKPENETPSYIVTVVDSEGNPIPGVVLYITISDAFGGQYYGKTDENGNAYWYDMDLNHTYKIVLIRKDGYICPEEVHFEPGEYDLPVFSSNICWYNVGDEPTLNIINRTSFKVNLNDFLQKAFPISGVLPSDEPLVLIVHTHATEAYQNNGQFRESDPYCTLNNDYNMIAVGDRLAQLLREQGISVIHDRTNHNEDYLKAYASSRKSVSDYLKEYPSIQLVLDLHRDAFGANDEEIRKNDLTATYNGQRAAKIAFIVTTSGGVMAHPNWQENAAAVFKFRLAVESVFPGITYKTWVQVATKHNYNQHLSTGSMLLEIGAVGNTLQEAFNAADVLAKAIGKMQGGAIVVEK